MDRGSCSGSKVFLNWISMKTSNYWCSHSHAALTKSPYGFNKHQESARAPVLSLHSLPSVSEARVNLPYLLHVFCYINAHWWKETLPPWIPLCCIQKSRPALLWQRRGANSGETESRFSPSRGLQSAFKRKRIEVKNTEASYVHTNPERNAIRCSLRDQVFLSEAFFFPPLTDELCSSKRSAGRINRIHNVSALPTTSSRYSADSHRGHLGVFGPQCRCRGENELHARMPSSVRAVLSTVVKN